MTTLRRMSWLSLVLAFGHIVFGAIVRITGSGMGCGDHWPRCQGYWFPPLSRPDLIIEVSHRYFAATLTGAILLTLLLAWRSRRAPGMGAVLRPLVLAGVLVVVAALFGAVTVWLQLANKAVIVTHLAIAMSLLATLVVAVTRAGGPPQIPRYRPATTSPSSNDFGPDDFPAEAWRASRSTTRGAYAAATIAFITVVLGALTANIPGANSACTGFPLCSGGVLPTDPSQNLQFIHRVFAFALVLHLFGMALTTTRREEHGPATLAWTAFGLTVVQVLVAATMVDLQLPAAFRSLHEAVGTAVWVAVFFFAYTSHASGAQQTNATSPSAAGQRPHGAGAHA